MLQRHVTDAVDPRDTVLLANQHATQRWTIALTSRYLDARAGVSMAGGIQLVGVEDGCNCGCSIVMKLKCLRVSPSAVKSFQLLAQAALAMRLSCADHITTLWTAAVSTAATLNQ